MASESMLIPSTQGATGCPPPPAVRPLYNSSLLTDPDENPMMNGQSYPAPTTIPVTLTACNTPRIDTVSFEIPKNYVLLMSVGFLIAIGVIIGIMIFSKKKER